MEFEVVSKKVIGCAIEVHRHLGPGLLESSYQKCLCHELELQGVSFVAEAAMPIEYKGKPIDCGYRIDLFVDQKLIVELKSVKAVEPIHEAQLLTYMKLSGAPTGLLLNFNVLRLKDGIKRMVL
ncbi:MAG: GxxExxY protein [Verrucomicrobiota bacterium]